MLGEMGPKYKEKSRYLDAKCRMNGLEVKFHRLLQDFPVGCRPLDLNDEQPHSR